MQTITGVVHGKTIELEQETGFADGQSVVVFVREKLPPGEGLRRSAGGWADAGPEFDRWLEETMRARRDDRAESGR
jgi:hypothetical protein